MRAFYPVLGEMELSAEFKHTTNDLRLSYNTWFPDDMNYPQAGGTSGAQFRAR